MYLTCARCGSIIGSAKDAFEAREINKEHLAECQTDT